ncbi:MAG TPA: hypothetical protein VHZ50_16420 [Puia sp.]|jgi:hypothetical protein|nr:hypothetical protein [Puia sp.]
MTPLQPFTIAGYTSGLQTDKKPFLIPDKAFSVLRNGYVFRERVIKRQGLELVGRLSRNFPGLTFGAFPSVTAPPPFTRITFTGNLYTTAGIVPEASATIAAGSVSISSLGGGYTWQDSNLDGNLITTATSGIGYNGVITNIVSGATTTISIIAANSLIAGDTVYLSGILGTLGDQLNNQYFTVLSSTPTDYVINVATTGTFIAGAGTSSFVAGQVNYLAGTFILSVNNGLQSSSITGSFSYNPNLPVMGIESRDLNTINNEQTIFFDTKYAYIFATNQFNWIAPYTWSGTDKDFFSSTNYQGADSSIRTFFVTNFVDDPGSPVRYTQDGSTFIDFAPVLDGVGTKLLQARIFIPYYGRLLAFNTIEGPALGMGGNKNFFTRVRFSQEGNPLDSDAWRVDIFGRGGFADAPTAETIIGVAFWKNTLIVFFERSTWQLRFVGEYGTPFLFERISSDFGSESTFSSLVFDQGILAIGDRAIISATSTSVNRIDEAIPDQVFDIRNVEAGPERVQGIRDFQRELAFWCFTDDEIADGTQKYPNSVLVYNYRNNTFAIFRDNVTAFGTLQPATGITWDSLNVSWDDTNTTWDSVQNNALFPKIVSGNQQGFIHYYGYVRPDEPSLGITNIDLTVTPITITVPNHNLENDEIVYIQNLSFVDTSVIPFIPLGSDLNNKIYLVKKIDDDNLSLFRWSVQNQQYFSNFSFTPIFSPSLGYLGSGVLSLFPLLDVQTKDLNPFAPKGKQLKASYIDFLMSKTASAAFSINLFFNTTSPIVGTIPTGNVGQFSSETYNAQPYYGNNTNPDILWHRFAQTIAGQFIRVQMTYSDDLMNDLNTHEQDWELNAMTLHLREGGKILF